MRADSALKRLRDVRFREHKRLARNPDDALIRATAGAEAQLADGGISDVHADDGEITVFEFEDVGAAVERRSLRTVGVRIRAEASSDIHTALIQSYNRRSSDFIARVHFVPKLSTQERIERELASLLKQRREALGLSKVVTARRAGLAVMTIFFVEELKRSPSINTLLRIAEALEVDLWKLLQTATRNTKRTGKA